MKINFNKILTISNINDIKKFNLNKPIHMNNYLFHYLIIFNKLNILKLVKFPIYKENDEGLNGFLLAAKYDNISILTYLIKKYPEYIYNKNPNNETFMDLLSINSLIKIIKKYPKLDYSILLTDNILDDIFINGSFKNIKFIINFAKKYQFNLLLKNVLSSSFNIEAELIYFSW